MSRKSEERDTLGTALKASEGVEAQRKCPDNKPLIVRLDGRAFHSFTNGLDKPFDMRLVELMRQTTRYLVKELGAAIGYTQSDEITLIWYVPEESESQLPFGGRFQKMASIAAALASVFFGKALEHHLPIKKAHMPIFDGRAWAVDSLREAYLNLLWRKRDAIKNSITMLALSHFSHNELHGVGSSAKLQMLRDVGDPWEDYKDSVRQGSYFARVTELTELPPETLEKIPVQYRPEGPIERSFVKEVSPVIEIEDETDENIVKMFENRFTSKAG